MEDGAQSHSTRLSAPTFPWTSDHCQLILKPNHFSNWDLQEISRLWQSPESSSNCFCLDASIENSGESYSEKANCSSSQLVSFMMIFVYPNLFCRKVQILLERTSKISGKIRKMLKLISQWRMPKRLEFPRLHTLWMCIAVQPVSVEARKPLEYKCRPRCVHT